MPDKTKITTKGWTETTIKHIKVTSFGLRMLATNEDWLSFNKHYPKIGRKRACCNLCKKNWEKTGSDVYIAFTTSGNKALCLSCFEELKSTIIIQDGE